MLKLNNRVSPYYFHVIKPFADFWKEYSVHNRKVLFVFGLGFDPRCLPALRQLREIFTEDVEVETICARFKNDFDKNLEDNWKYTEDCLRLVREITSVFPNNFYHHEIEVNMFSQDRELIGAEALILEATKSFRSPFEDYTDIIVDISAFPRTLMYSFLGHLWRKRKQGQNLFAILTETPLTVEITEEDYIRPSFMFGGKTPSENANISWIPVLGGGIKRFEQIYDFLKPKDVIPIIPFPSNNPRLGDEIILKSKKQLFDLWQVPFNNVMYASGEIPFDVFRKIQDIVKYYEIFPEITAVVSALSGRSLSLGVLLAALWSDIPICHTQPTTYHIKEEDRDFLKQACKSATTWLFWLDGKLYET